VTTGRTEVARRALERTVAASAASVLGVSAKAVRVRLSDDRGALAIGLAAPVASRSDVGLVTRAGAWRDEIHQHVTRITGRTISRVALELTRTDIGTKGGAR
jgi:hypothetical protein